MRFDPYVLVKDDASVQAVLGSEPMRFWPFGEGDETPLHNPDQRVVYATWQTAVGLPQNTLSGRPSMDQYRIQIDVWAPKASDADSAADVLRDALEPHGYQVSTNPEGRDPETRLYRVSFDFEFWQSR